MKEHLNVHNFPPQYEDGKLKGWKQSALDIDVPKVEPGVLCIKADEELYESRVYPFIGDSGWSLKILAKRKKGADSVTLVIKTHTLATVPKEVPIETYHKHVSTIECAFEHIIDLDHVTICHADDYIRVMEGVKNEQQ